MSGKFIQNLNIFCNSNKGRAFLHKEGTIQHFRESVEIKDLKFSWILKSIRSETLRLLPCWGWWVILPAYLKDKNNRSLKKD